MVTDLYELDRKQKVPKLDRFGLVVISNAASVVL